MCICSRTSFAGFAALLLELFMIMSAWLQRNKRYTIPDHHYLLSVLSAVPSWAN